MRILVTGASGFLGGFVVQEALERGHQVRAMVRPASDLSRLPWSADHRVEVVKADLRRRHGLDEHVRGVDAVLHLAAAKQGDLYAQLAGTVVATENLLAAMTQAGVARLVLVSSFSVYEYLRRRQNSVLDESSELVRCPAERDEYAQTKLLQEQLVQRYATEHSAAVTILRPGVIYGPENLWTARLGMRVSDGWWIRTGARARLPLTYVENCAQSIVMAAENDNAIGETMNVVDDHQPTQREYLNRIRPFFSPAPKVISVPWPVMRMLASFIWMTNVVALRKRAKVPGIFSPAKLHARCKPLSYANTRIRAVLGWEPRFSFAQALQRSTEAR